MRKYITIYSNEIIKITGMYSCLMKELHPLNI